MSRQGKMKDFTDLDSWKAAHSFLLHIKQLPSFFPATDNFLPTSKAQRSVHSIAGAIADGYVKKAYHDRVDVYYQTRRLLNELQGEILYLKERNYVNQNDFDNIMGQLETSFRLLQNLI